MSRLIIIFLLLNMFTPQTYAQQNLPMIRTNPSIVCDTADQAIEILEVYQSYGAKSAGQIFRRLYLEKNEQGEGKCVITQGVYLVIDKKIELIIQEDDGDLMGVVLEVYDPRIKRKIYVILTTPVNSPS